jgi:hypothetical protein
VEGGPAIAIVPHTVLRVALWPVESLAPCAAPELAARAAALDDAEAALRDDGRALADAIHAAVPGVDDADARRWLLAVRRAAVATRSAAWSGRAATPAPGGVPAELVARVAALADRLAPHAAAVAALADAHDAHLEGELVHLREVGGTGRFRSALHLAAPAVAARWDRVRVQPARTADRARVRRLEGTVFQYLCRAAGRPTPSGRWAGALPVAPPRQPRGVARGPLVACAPDPTAARVAVTVDLRPFAVLLDAWARTQAGRDEHHPLRVNPTWHDDDGTWWWEPPGLTTWEHATPSCAERRVLLDIAAAGPTTAHAAAVEDRDVVDALVRRGLLASTWRLPAGAADAWAALDAAARELHGPHAAGWADTLAAVRAGCDCIAGALTEPGTDVDAVVRGRDAVDGAVRALWRAAGLPGDPAGDARATLVRVDERPGVRARLADGAVDRLDAAVTATLAVLGDGGDAERHRRAGLGAWTSGPLAAVARRAQADPAWAALVGREATTPVARRADALRVRGIDPGPGERTWAERLAPHRGAAVLDLADLIAPAGPEELPAGAGPWGTLVVHAADRAWARWGRPQPGLFVGRLAATLAAAGGRDDPEVRALVAAHESLLDAAPGGAVVVAGSDAENPNAALGLPGGSGVVEPHGGTGTCARDVHVVVDPDHRTARLAVDAGPEPGPGGLPVYPGTSSFGRVDPCGRVLRAIAMSHGWELVSFGFPLLDAERDGGPPLPRLTVGPDVVVAARRWVLEPAELAAVRAADGVERYRRWCRLARRRGLPELALVRRGPNPGGVESLLVVTSPLAVRTLGDRRDDDAVVVTELPEPIASWPRGPDGGHHLSELAVTWHTDPGSREQ